MKAEVLARGDDRHGVCPGAPGDDPKTARPPGRERLIRVFEEELPAVAR
jgi:hypothetical protein